MTSEGLVLDPAAYTEVVGRLVSIRNLAAGLAEAFDDPIMQRGAEEARASLERVLDLLEYRE